jgi:hypothetical protein
MAFPGEAADGTEGRKLGFALAVAMIEAVHVSKMVFT